MEPRLDGLVAQTSCTTITKKEETLKVLTTRMMMAERKRIPTTTISAACTALDRLMFPILVLETEVQVRVPIVLLESRLWCGISGGRNEAS
jgi:hypothetical protein